MFLAGVTPLLFGAVLGLHLDEPVDLPLADAVEITEAFARSLEARTRRTIVTDDVVWSVACAAHDRCVPEIRARLRTEDVVVLQVFGGPIKVRVVAELFGAGGRDARAELKVPREPESWPGLFDRAADELFVALGPTPEPATAAAVTASSAATTSTGAPGSFRPLPWIVLGAGAVAAAAGVAFGVSSVDARDQIQSGGVETGDRFRELESAMHSRATAANVCWAAAIGAAVTAIVLFATE